MVYIQFEYSISISDDSEDSKNVAFSLLVSVFWGELNSHEGTEIFLLVTVFDLIENQITLHKLVHSLT